MKSYESIYKTVSCETLEAIEQWAGYYRENPHRFAEDILNLELKTFQKILLVEMNINNSFVFIASRG